MIELFWNVLKICIFLYYFPQAVVNFNGYLGCQKCCVRGKYFKNYHVMSFPRTNCTRRTDESFREREQPEHHKELRSIIEELDINMVDDFPVSDPLHLVELGVMRRCLIRWKEGTKSYRNKFNRVELNKINFLLRRANGEMPSEIHRAVRDLNTLHFWKGTEYRTFLLYVGIVVLKNALTLEEYDHFKLLFCSILLCSSDVYRNVVENTPLVDNLLEDYIENYINIYGEQTISSNVHNLTHLIDDVRRFGNLNSISTYPFENSLRLMKLKLRAMNKPIEQIARGISEISALMDSETHFESIQNNENEAQLKFPLKGDSMKFRQVLFKDYRLSSLKFGDKWFMNKKNQIVEFKYATKVNNEIVLHGCGIENQNDLFADPFASSKINIYFPDISTDMQNNEIYSKFEDIKCKMVCLSFESRFVFQPLLHTLL